MALKIEIGFIYLKFKMVDGGLWVQLSGRIVTCLACERPCIPSSVLQNSNITMDSKGGQN